MFSVECEKCKNAIPLGMIDCPVCKAKEAVGDTQPGMAPVGAPTAPQTAGPMHPPPAPVYNTPPAAPTYSAPPPNAPMYAAPPAAPVYAPPQPVYQQTYTVPQPKAALPPWLVAVGVAVLMGLVLAVGYLVLLPKLRNGGRSSTAATAPTLDPPTPAAPAAKPAAGGAKFGKYIEIVGIRIVEENKKAMVKFLVVNHAAAELTDVNGTVEIHPTNGNAMVGRVEVKIPSIAAYESREFSASLNTTMRAYEIPDWQFLRGQFVE
jgi:hypothetical protein